ncbi:MAG: hypothetical protein R3268_04685, partial [Acidiferrobacterales bacterium]|nr:hypothetical protein [Acidiferrobacterales bacterium]
VALSAMFAMGIVVSSTIKLNRFRKKIRVKRTMFDLRDLSVIRQPQNYDVEEVRLVRKHWIACATTLALILLMLALSPGDLPQRL